MLKRQFFIFGASVAYGVGSTEDGWSGLLKQYVHNELYGKNSFGEKAEVYNFAKPGADIEFVLDTFENQLLDYERECPLTAFILVGLNDTKAIDNPNNFVSDESKFEKDYNILLNNLSKHFEVINILSFYGVDENKVHPKINPLDGSASYFKNDRICKFNDIIRRLCCKYNKANFIDLMHLNDNWVEDCLFKDGLHPNDKGHKLIFNAIKDYVII